VELTILTDAFAATLRLPPVLSVTPSWGLRRKITQLLAGVTEDHAGA
jgi:hypothetical protein